MKTIKTHEKIVELVLESLKKDVIPWEKGWSGSSLCFNPITGSRYRGVNFFVLRMVSDLEKYDDPRWMTFNQIKSHGYFLKNAKGKGVPIVYWSAYDNKEKKMISSEEASIYIKDDPDRVRYVAKTYTVFNASHIDGIEPYPERDHTVTNNQIYLFLKNYLENEGIHLLHGGDSAYYQPELDQIRLPEPDSFKNLDYYLDTMAHEISHSTGHPSRLNRPQLKDYHCSIEERSREELRAEIGSAFINFELGLEPSEERVERHQAYIQNWISVIEKNPDELIRAIRDAEKIQDYVYEKGNVELYIDRAQPIVEEAEEKEVTL